MFFNKKDNELKSLQKEVEQLHNRRWSLGLEHAEAFTNPKFEGELFCIKKQIETIDEYIGSILHRMCKIRINENEGLKNLTLKANYVFREFDDVIHFEDEYGLIYKLLLVDQTDSSSYSSIDLRYVKLDSISKGKFDFTPSSNVIEVEKDADCFYLRNNKGDEIVIPIYYSELDSELDEDDKVESYSLVLMDYNGEVVFRKDIEK